MTRRPRTRSGSDICSRSSRPRSLQQPIRRRASIGPTANRNRRSNLGQICCENILLSSYTRRIGRCGVLCTQSRYCFVVSHRTTRPIQVSAPAPHHHLSPVLQQSSGACLHQCGRVHTCPVEAGVHTCPVAAGVHTCPVAARVHTCPVAARVHTCPVAGRVHTCPVAAGVHTCPVAARVHTCPVAARVHTCPVAGRVHTCPVATGVHTYPVAVRVHLCCSSLGTHLSCSS